MLLFAIYLLKVVICSAIMFAYYWLALRNKRFHQYNRFYLLGSVVLSCLIPFIKLQFFATGNQQQSVVRLLSAVSDSNAYLEAAAIPIYDSLFNINAIAAFLFTLVSVVLLGIFLKTLSSIFRQIYTCPKQQWSDIFLVFSQAKGTPYSFFKYIFWNRQIDINTPAGYQVLQHELTHVKEKHSVDKVLLSVILIITWINPFFWMIRRELNMIHEFIADKKAINDGDTQAFAAMLLKATYPQQQFALTHSFFHSPIKRRLVMLTTSTAPNYSYVRRLMILPLLAVVTLFFAFRLKHEDSAILLEKTYTVVIDAGHGGADAGAKGNGITEKDLVLSLARLVSEGNKNANIKILLARNTDIKQPLTDKVAMTTSTEKADLFISLHADYAPVIAGSKTMHGPSIVVSRKNQRYASESRILGSLLSHNLKDIFSYQAPLLQKQQGIYVLDNMQTCPAVLLEVGYLSSKTDAAILSNETHQESIAKAILKSIDQYFSLAEKGNNDVLLLPVNGPGVVEVKDGKPVLGEHINIIEVIKAQPAKPLQEVEVMDKLLSKQKDAPNTEKPNSGTVKINGVSIEQNDGAKPMGKPWVVLDGKEMSMEAFSKLDVKPERIESINVLKGSSAEKFGEKAREGVLIITTKKEDLKEITVTGYKADKVFTSVEVPPYYEKGMGAFAEYIRSNMKYPAEALQHKQDGAVAIEFIVGADGTLSQFRKVTNRGYGMEEEAVRLLQNAGPWKVGMQNGNKVAVRMVQQIIFSLPGKI